MLTQVYCAELDNNWIEYRVDSTKHIKQIYEQFTYFPADSPGLSVIVARKLGTDTYWRTVCTFEYSIADGKITFWDFEV